MTGTTSSRTRGFTLIEVAVAVAIIGLAITALMASLAAGTRANHAGQQLTQAVFLAQEVREWTIKLPFSDTDPADVGNPPGPDGSDPQYYVDDLDDLLSVTYSPPRDGRGVALSSMVGWTQTISLTWRDPDDLATVVTPGASDIIHVSVEVSYRGKTMLTAGWLVARRLS